MDAISTAIAACGWAPSHLLILSANVFDPLIYYSHITALILSLGLGTLVFVKNRSALVTRLLFVLTLCLAVWLFSDLVVWATEYSQRTLFFWSLTDLIEPFVYAFSFYFVYSFVMKRDMPFGLKLAVFIPLFIVIALTPTRFSMMGYDLATCERDAVEGPLVYFNYALEVLYAVGILILGARQFVKRKGDDRAQIALAVLGTVFFLLSFAFGNIIGTFFSSSAILGDYSWTVGQYGLFGVPVFVGLLAFIIVRFRAFNIGLLAAQALILGLVAVLGSEFAFVQSTTNRALVSVTLVMTGVLGIMLIRSVRREVEQRLRIEIQEQALMKANEQQVVLIHFITHQIKGFVTKSRNIFSMMLEGEFGPVPDTMKPMVEEGFRSDTKGAETIQEILNAANIKSGKVTYAQEPVDLKELLVSVIQDLKPAADAKGLALTLVPEGNDFVTTGDRMQLTNALKNLIDNSVKYTPSGSVTVSLAKQAGKLRISIKDTGVGITHEDMQLLFTEGGHGKDSTKVNVDSTGFGLYIVKNIMEAHNGRVWAESEGAGKGSTFVAELPAA